MANNNNHIDPVEGVSAVSKQKELIALQKQTQAEENAWKKALDTKDPARIYSCFWLVIQILNHVGLDVTDGAVIAQAQLMDVEHKMQQCMIKISKALSDIQGNEAGYHVYQANGTLAPDTFLGLKSSYYNMSLTGNPTQAGSVTETGKGLEDDVNSLISSLKQLYYSDASDASAPTVGDLSKIVNPYVWQNGKDFDLTGLWQHLEASYNSAGFNNPYGTSFKMVSSNSSDKASLMQQYMYYKAQSTVYTTNSDTVNATGGDITKLLSFDPPKPNDPSQNMSCDAMISQVLQTLNMFNTSNQVETSATGYTSFGLQPTNEPLLKLILLGLNNIYHGDAGNEYAGVYAEFNMAAYNSYWSKPGADKSAQTLDPSLLGPGLPWSQVVPGAGTSGADVLTNWYTQTNSVQSSIGSDTSTNSSTMQAQTANEGDEVSVGQNAIKSLNQYVNALCQNQNSA